jgi:hypothetical protein
MQYYSISLRATGLFIQLRHNKVVTCAACYLLPIGHTITLYLSICGFILIWSIIIRKPISMCGVKLSCSIIKTNLPHGRNHNNKVMKSHACRPWPARRLSQELSPVSHHLAHHINSRALSQLWTGVTRNYLLISDYIEQTTRVFIKSQTTRVFIKFPPCRIYSRSSNLHKLYSTL